MKRILFFLLLVLTMTSCEKELGELTDYESPRLVVNALFSAQDSLQPLRIRMTGPTQVQLVEGADVSLALNGTEFYHCVTANEDSLLVPTRDFQVGDVVSVSVRKGDMQVQASAQVLPAVTIEGIDTLTVMARRYSWSNMEPHRRLLVHLRLPSGWDPSQTYFFRAEVQQRVIEPFSFAVDGDTVSEAYYRENNYYNSFSYASDPALCETEGLDQENLSVSFDWLEGLTNVYRVFRSSYFQNGEYTLRLDFAPPYSLSRYGWAHEPEVRIYAISRMEYNYLLALNAFTTLDTGTIYDSEPGITTNVEGGAGIFCIESVASASIYDDHHLIKVGDSIHDF